MATTTGDTQQPLVAHRIASLVVDDKPQEPNSIKTFLFGNVDLSYFFYPVNFYSKNVKGKHHLRFKRHYDFASVLMTILLGFQHACAALGTIIVPSLMLSGVYPDHFRFYILQAAVLIAGICTVINCLEMKHSKVPFQFGSGLLSILSNSSVFTPVFLGCMTRLELEDGVAIHDAFGKMLGTTAVCSLAYIALTLVPRKYMKQVFPPMVSGIIITLIGAHMMIHAVQLWGGGIVCEQRFEDGVLCRMNGDVHLPYGSPEYLGLGLFVLVVYFVCELFGSPFVRHNIITISVVSVYVISCFFKKDGDRYVSGDYIDDTPSFAFLWTTTYKLDFYKGGVLPVLGAFLVTYLESTALLTATLEDSKVDITSAEADNRIQGGLLVTAFGSLFSVLATGLPLRPSAQNNVVVTMTGQACNLIGISSGIWLVIFGVLGKFLALYLEIPGSVKGAIGTLLFAGVIWTGLKILSRQSWDRRMSVVVFFSLTFGLARIIVDPFINDNLWEYDDDMSDFVTSLRFCILSMLRVSYFLGGFLAVFLNLMLPKDMEFEEKEPVIEETYEAVVEA